MSRDRDEVDGIVAAWQREHPDLDTSPMQVFSRITRLGRRVATLRQQVFSAHGVEPWEFDVLAALRRSGEPYELSPGQLATETMVTSGTMTNRLDRLTERGLVRRIPSLVDRRGVTVRLTDDGRSHVDAAISALVAAERELLATVSEVERETLATHLRVLLLAMNG